MSDSFLKIVHGKEKIDPLVKALHPANSPAFFLCLGSTQTSDIEGISAAGATADARRLTPAADAEALVLGRMASGKNLPVSPRGIVSPVVVTRACLQVSSVKPGIVDCGAFVGPQVPHLSVSTTPANSVESGKAMPLDMVISLLVHGFDTGIKSSVSGHPQIIAECVPGGTTTALGVLHALGYDARTALSGSVPRCNHDLRFAVVEEGLKQAQLSVPCDNPIEILAAIGDPMQPFVVGMALALCQSDVPVILAGGSQMLAVFALCKALAPDYGINFAKAEIGVFTTKWVAFDESAAIADICVQIDAPLMASCPDFRQSRHAGLQAYEEGNVKEGVGAGAALALAYQALNGDFDTLMRHIDIAYDEMVASHALDS